MLLQSNSLGSNRWEYRNKEKEKSNVKNFITYIFIHIFYIITNISDAVTSNIANQRIIGSM